MAGSEGASTPLSEESCIPSVVQELNSQTAVQKNTLLAVLKFLHQNNFKDTEQLLLKEANIKDDDKQQDGGAHPDMSKALAAYKSDNDPTVYSDCYANLRSFIDSSLDVHKCELSLVLYPMFMHLYLELVFNNHHNEARNFFAKFHEDHLELYEEYIKHISTITKREHMERNQFVVDTFRTSNYVVRMSRDSYTHLKRHLVDTKLTLLLNVVQEHMFIDVYEGPPRSKQQIDLTVGAMAGEARREANKAKILHGLLKEPEISIPAEEEEEPEDDKDKPKKKKPKRDPLLTKKTKNDPNAPGVSRIPLPELKDADKLEKVNSYKDAAKRLKVGPGNIPPICFYTFVNAFSGVSSASFTEDATMLAAGFQDSVVRVWTLTRQKLRSMKSGDDLSEVDKEAEDIVERMMDDKTAAESKTLCGHSGPVYGVNFSPDKQYLLSCSEDSTVRLWSLLTWTNLVCYKGHNYPVWDVHFSPQAHYFVSGGYDRLGRLWSTDHYQPLRVFAGHLADVDCVRIHPNANYVATASSDRTVRLWDVLTGLGVRIMTGHKGTIFCLSFSPDGRYLVSAGADKIVHLWDLASGGLFAQMKGHTAAVHALAFSRDGAVLATGGLDNCVKLWDLSLLQEDRDIPENASSATHHPSELVSTPEFASFFTKATPVIGLHFSRRNLLLGTGGYRP